MNFEPKRSKLFTCNYNKSKTVLFCLCIKVVTAVLVDFILLYERGLYV